MRKCGKNIRPDWSSNPIYQKETRVILDTHTHTHTQTHTQTHKLSDKFLFVVMRKSFPSQ